ncbi:MAG: hypothetical protein V7742_07850 [Halioglobus sp.]
MISIQNVPSNSTKYVATVAWLAITLVCAWAYWPGTSGPGMLDDGHSLAKLDILKTNPDDAIHLIFDDHSGPLGRPVSVATLVAEKLYLDATVSTTKKVNIILHIFNAQLVLLLFIILLRSQGTPEYLWVAIVCASIWLYAPLFVSTVLYAVQRMAMLSATFVIGACLVYVHWRSTGASRRKVPVLVFSGLLLGLLGIFSKENAIVVIPLIVLIEVLWFSDSVWWRAGSLWGVRISRWLMIALLLLTLSVFYVAYDWAVQGYVGQSFTMWERVLTQTRVLWDYVGQFYSPEVARMGLYHDDILVSRSLISPNSTMYAVVAWAALAVSLAMSLRYKLGRLVAFCVLFFLVGHSLESTIFPLELYYEHRNYLPAIGLALLPAVLYRSLALRFTELRAPMLVWLFIFPLVLLSQTSSQVQIWSSAPLFNVYNVTFHPESHRANVAMANRMSSLGELQSALEYSAHAHRARGGDSALPIETHGDWILRDLALGCIASSRLQINLVNGIRNLEGDFPIRSARNLNILFGLYHSGRCTDPLWATLSQHFSAIYLAGNSKLRASRDIYALLASFENSTQSYDLAYAYNEKQLNLAPVGVRGLLMKLHFATALGLAEEVNDTADKLKSLHKLGKLSPSELKTLLLYIDDKK